MPNATGRAMDQNRLSFRQIAQLKERLPCRQADMRQSRRALVIE